MDDQGRAHSRSPGDGAQARFEAVPAELLDGRQTSASRRRFAWMSGEKCDSVSVRAGTARELVAHGGQQAVAERHQRGGEPLVLGDQPRGLADRRHLGVAGGRITRPAAQRSAVHDDDPARAQ